MRAQPFSCCLIQDWVNRTLALIARRYRLSANHCISHPAPPVERYRRQARRLDSESTSGGNGHMIRNSPEIICVPRQISLPAKFVSGGFLLGAACRRSVPNANRHSPRITQPVRSPDAIWRASRQKFAMPRSPANPWKYLAEGEESDKVCCCELPDTRAHLAWSSTTLAREAATCPV